ncbi:S9 family peptidase, partial [Flavobacteriaceae bacterium]|nr:S9 family peptidase [Flavobacteriaceae bacterium]
MKSIKALALSLLFLFPLMGKSQNNRLSAFEALDVFELEWASDPQIAPDASQVVYRRNGFDIMSDKAVGNLWILNADGSNHRKLSTREGNEYGAKWSPDGKRIAFISSTDQGSELYMYWMESGQLAKLSHLKSSPSNLIWSKDGQQLFFTQFVATKAPVLIKMPPKPRGAKWADPARITDRLKHEA